MIDCRSLLILEPERRLSIRQIARHPWLLQGRSNSVLVGRKQCCGTVTFFTVPVPAPTFDKFRFRSLLVKFTVPVPVPAPVPVRAPYLDHKKHSFKKKFGKNLAFLHRKLFVKVK
jgi:hypothetical protein